MKFKELLKDRDVIKLITKSLYRINFKEMGTKNFLLWVVITSALLVGCDDEMPDYYDSRSYDLADFDAVELGDALQVEIIQGDEFSVVAKGETQDLEDLELRVENGILTGQYRNGSSSHKRTKIVIFMPQLRGLMMEAATDTEVTGFQEVQENFFLRLSGASAARVEANVQSMTVRIYGASEIILKGEGDVLNAVVSGASHLNANEFPVDAAEVEIDGASEAFIGVGESLEGSVHGSSLLKYHGNPEIIDVFVATDSRMSKF